MTTSPAAPLSEFESSQLVSIEACLRALSAADLNRFARLLAVGIIFAVCLCLLWALGFGPLDSNLGRLVERDLYGPLVAMNTLP
ncbi:MAG: hypothetical protein JWN95_4150 [Frankiales bacterium]|nr:hypothetical protein [Frankiales bacterium]